MCYYGGKKKEILNEMSMNCNESNNEYSPVLSVKSKF